MSRRSEWPQSERGATAIFVAITMLLLIGMAAIAIDVGAGFNERRQNQSASDVAVLAGAIDFLDLGECGPGGVDAGCNRALDIVAQNLTAPITGEAWETLWRDCRDPGKPEGFAPLEVAPGWTGFVGLDADGNTFSNRIDCISSSQLELRLRLPDQLTDTTFGAVLGLDELTTSAFAQARLLRSPGGPGAIIPFGVVAGTNGYECLLQASKGVVEYPCVGGVTGNYGAVLSQNWGSPVANADCGNSSWKPGMDELAFNIASGLDHEIDRVENPGSLSFPFAPFPANPDGPGGFDQLIGQPDTAGAALDEVTILDRCTEAADGRSIGWDSQDGPAADSGPINTLYVDTGADAREAALRGFITESGDYSGIARVSIPPRLVVGSTCPGSPEPHHCITLDSVDYYVEGRPLWHSDFLAGSFGTWPNGAAAFILPDGTACNTLPSDEEIMNCVLEDIEDTSYGITAQIFDEDIQFSRRFVWVPEFGYSTWGVGEGWMPILTFRPSYIHALWFEVPGPGLVKYQAGGPPYTYSIDIQNSQALRQVSAFALPEVSLPSSVVNSCPDCAGRPSETELTR